MLSVVSLVGTVLGLKRDLEPPGCGLVTRISGLSPQGKLGMRLVCNRGQLLPAQAAWWTFWEGEQLKSQEQPSASNSPSASAPHWTLASLDPDRSSHSACFSCFRLPPSACAASQEGALTEFWTLSFHPAIDFSKFSFYSLFVINPFHSATPWQQYENTPPVCTDLLFACEDEEREKERESKTSIGCFLYTPYWVCSSKAGHAPWPGIKLGTSLCMGWGSTNWTTLARTKSLFLNFKSVIIVIGQNFWIEMNESKAMPNFRVFESYFQIILVKEKRQQAQNGVTYVKHHNTKLGNLLDKLAVIKESDCNNQPTFCLV